MNGSYKFGNVWWAPHDRIRFPEKTIKGYYRPIATVSKISPLSAMIVPGTTKKCKEDSSVKVDPSEFPKLKKTTYLLPWLVQPLQKKFIKDHAGLLPERLQNELIDKVRAKLLINYGIILS